MFVLAVILALGLGVRGMVGHAPVSPAQPVSLSPGLLPLYTLRTVIRMLAAMLASLLFTFTYATVAAKNRWAAMVLIPLLDVLQSVPVLGYLSFTVLFFVDLFPGNSLGPELAAVFAIFTSQAWNMAFSFYQSLRTVPRELDEASRSMRASAWQRFCRLEVPFAIPGLVWNMMMSMSAGWFFVVASEAIVVGNTQIALPGIGSYVARAIETRNLAAVGWAIAAMLAAVTLYDQLLFRPLVIWAGKFRFEQSAPQAPGKSWVINFLGQSSTLRRLAAPCSQLLQQLARARLSLPAKVRQLPLWQGSRPLAIVVASALGMTLVAWVAWQLIHSASTHLAAGDYLTVARNGALTFVRVLVLVAIASVVWVPIGVAVGLRPRLTRMIQPIAQFLAAFPANLLFPVAVYTIVHWQLSPRLWLMPLMILGTQWYILFNVIAGASAFGNDLREAAATYRVRPAKWWRQVMLPGIFPYYITGAITASGGCWNASIVSEWVSWGHTRLDASGLGAYIAEQTQAGDFPRIGLGIAMMSAMVVAMNRLLWRPLYRLSERRTRLD